MPRPQSIAVNIASIANTRMSLSHSRHLQCYLKTRYIHGALRSGYATMRNAQCNNSDDNLFWIRCIRTLEDYFWKNKTGFLRGWVRWIWVWSTKVDMVCLSRLLRRRANARRKRQLNTISHRRQIKHTISNLLIKPILCIRTYIYIRCWPSGRTNQWVKRQGKVVDLPTFAESQKFIAINNLFIYLFIYSFIYLFVCLFVYLFVYLFIAIKN